MAERFQSEGMTGCPRLFQQGEFAFSPAPLDQSQQRREFDPDAPRISVTTLLFVIQLIQGVRTTSWLIESDNDMNTYELVKRPLKRRAEILYRDYQSRFFEIQRKDVFGETRQTRHK